MVFIVIFSHCTILMKEKKVLIILKSIAQMIFNVYTNSIYEKRGVTLKKMKKYISCILAVVAMFTALPINVQAEAYWPQAPEVQSQAAIVMEANTGAILYEKNTHEQHYPASITKILTTLLAIENSKMDEVVTFSHDAVYNTEGSGIARDVGEEMTMEQCLYAVMLESANECAYAVAEHVDGDIDTFIDRMNQRVKDLGCTDTHFNNCNGLPDPDHYTSAYDMALIAKAAYANETFRIICGTKRYTIPFTNKHTDAETFLQNHHAMLYPLKTTEYLYEYCMGGKTGYTSAANSTLVTYAEKDGMTLICVVMYVDAPGHYTDTKALFDYCFSNFQMVNTVEQEEQENNTNGSAGDSFTTAKGFVEVENNSQIVLPVGAEFKDVESKIRYDSADRDTVGTLEYTYAGHIVGDADINTTNASVEKYHFKNQKLADTEEMQESQERSNSFFQIDIRRIGKILLVLAACLCLAFLGYHLFEKIGKWHRKKKAERKPKPKYKEIKPSRRYWRRRR